MCGVVGLMRKHPVAGDLVNALGQLQHRGQDSAGIYVYDPKNQKERLIRGQGKVHEVFDPEDLLPLKGDWGIGHVRYTTSGSTDLQEAQPCTIHRGGYTISLVFNGNIINDPTLRKAMGKESFSSDCDVEVLTRLFADHFTPDGDLFEAIIKAVDGVYEKAQGAYSVVGMIAGHGLFAFRDPRGIRPLLFAQSNTPGDYGFCSETYPLSFLGFEQVRDVPPGEVLFVDNSGNLQGRRIRTMMSRHCAFEYVYFARANSNLERQEVYRVRRNLGTALGRKAKKLGLNVDCVIGVPSTSQPAANAAAWELGARLEEGFLRKDNTGRSFIQPSQAARERTVSQKLAPITSVFRGNDILIVDDSIVRGTVSRAIIRIARECGARKVYFASTFPPIRHPCYYGIDMALAEKLVAHGRNYEDIAREIGADCVIYNDAEDLQAAIGSTALCMACVDGSYPTPTEDALRLQTLRAQAEEREALVLIGSN